MNNFLPDEPLIMHVDLNSCFATVEQQARPMLRGRPVAIVNRNTEHTAIVTASYEAKAKGVVVGMKLREAKKICPGLIAIESDPSKYKYVYRKLLAIMRDYSAHVVMKSIDEGVIDFHQASPGLIERGLVEIGHEIKRRLKDEIGIWMSCNIGISTNRFLAKTAANLHKPDGLDIITSQNIREVFSTLKLTDLTGIAHANKKRLNSVGIYTPLQFIDADEVVLKRIVFKSVVGEWWYKRLRGYEVDDVEVSMQRVGRQYVLESFDLSYDEILQRLHHLCESVGGRLRLKQKMARGVYIYARTFNHQYWHSSLLSPLPFFSDQAIYAQAIRLFKEAPSNIREIGVHCYNLEESDISQLSLFADEIVREQQISFAVDELNRRFGERTIHSADTLNTNSFISSKIPFGGVNHL